MPSVDPKFRGGPIVRFGGKGKIAPELLPHFARARLYVEPFFGAGGMFFAVPPGLYEREVVNDLNHNLVTFFKMLRDRTDDLILACRRTPYAREELERAVVFDGLDELEVARRVWVAHRQSRVYTAGAPTGAAWRRGLELNFDPVGAAETKIGQLQQYADRLRQVFIDCDDALDFVGRWAKRETFVYADPPYLHATRANGGAGEYGDCEMTEAQHVALLDLLLKAANTGTRVALSGYAHGLYDDALSEWRRLEIEVNTSDSSQPRVEILWMSYPPEDELGVELAGVASRRQPRTALGKAAMRQTLRKLGG